MSPNSSTLSKKIDHDHGNIFSLISDDVVNEVQPTFEEDGVPNEVLEMLKNLWLRKLNERENDIEEYATIPETEVVASSSRASIVEGSWPSWVEGNIFFV